MEVRGGGARSESDKPPRSLNLKGDYPLPLVADLQGGRRLRALPRPPGRASAAADVRVGAGPGDASPRVEGGPGDELAAGTRGWRRHLTCADHAPRAEGGLNATRLQTHAPVRAQQGADARRRPHRLRLSVR